MIKNPEHAPEFIPRVLDKMVKMRKKRINVKEKEDLLNLIGKTLKKKKNGKNK